MIHHKTKNTLVIDHDEQYVPIVRAVDGEVQLSGNFSLAEQNTRSRERLQRLIDFIHHNHSDNSVGVSHRLAAQVVYLAYWENYPLGVSDRRRHEHRGSGTLYTAARVDIYPGSIQGRTGPSFRNPGMVALPLRIDLLPCRDLAHPSGGGRKDLPQADAR